jgi:hypothetical protein
MRRPAERAIDNAVLELGPPVRGTRLTFQCGQHWRWRLRNQSPTAVNDLAAPALPSPRAVTTTSGCAACHVSAGQAPGQGPFAEQAKSLIASAKQSACCVHHAEPADWCRTEEATAPVRRCGSRRFAGNSTVETGGTLDRIRRDVSPAARGAEGGFVRPTFSRIQRSGCTRLGTCPTPSRDHGLWQTH